MRVILFFDLPTLTKEDKTEYRKFRRFLIKNGYMMLQESVYCKLALNSGAVKQLIDNIYKNQPEKGLIQVLAITEKQYSKIELIIGDVKSEVLDTDQRLVIL